MDFSKQIEFVSARIEDLRKIKEILYGIEDTICGIEKEVSDIDASLPSDAEIFAMPDGPQKQQINDLIGLNEEAFALIDELIGPPQDELTGEPEGTAYSPEARGTREISLDDILGQMVKSGKNNAS